MVNIDSKQQRTNSKLLNRGHIILIVSCIAVLVISIVSIQILLLIKNKVALNISVAQVEDGQNLQISWTTDKTIDEVSIEIFHNGNKLNQKTLCKYEDIMKGTWTEEGIYGKQNVVVSVKRNGVSTVTEREIALSASEYNIAPLVATMPVTLFSLEIDNITNHGAIPTFVWLERPQAWNYSRLPENVHLMPTIDRRIHTTGDIVGAYTETAKYVKELHEINPNSVFHFYFNDAWSSGLIEATYANNLPEDKWDAILYTDGSATFETYNECFGGSNADQVYAKMVSDYTMLKRQVKKSGSYSVGDGKKYSIDPDFSIRNYAYIMTEQNDNIKWIVTGLEKTFAPNNGVWTGNTAGGKIQTLKAAGKFVRVNIGDYFNSSSPKYLDTEKQTQLKNLYDFTQVADAFRTAQDAGKKIMIIIGSTPAEEVTYLEENMEINVKALKAFYGDEYAYFYKGHPGVPTYNYPTKLEALHSLGLVDVDSSIAAEFFFFFYPEAYASGIQSSTFMNVDAEHVFAMFNTKPTDSNSGLDNYQTKIDVFMNDGIGSIYESLVGTNQWLLQFADGYSIEYDAAIYNMTSNTLTYYKNGVVVA